MNNKEKIELWIQDLSERGLKSWNNPSLFCRMLWAIGIWVRPPFFNPFAFNFLLFSLLSMIVLYLFVSWFYESISRMAAIWIVSSVITGFIQAAYFRRIRKTLNLPSWKEYGK